MKNWVKTDVTKISESNSGDKRKKTLHFMMSPYDVPEAIRAYEDNSEQVFVIEFKYIPINEKRLIEENSGVRFEIGKNTQRIYKIFLVKSDEAFDTELVFTKSPELHEQPIESAENAIDNFVRYHEHIYKQSPNKYDAAKSALKEYRSYISSPVEV